MTRSRPNADAAHRLGLGLDVGGTATRWALVDAGRSVLAEGVVGGFTALMMGSAEGRKDIAATLAELARAVLDSQRGRPTDVFAGITGFSDDDTLRFALAQRVATAFMLALPAVTIVGDVELAYFDVFQPDEGVLVYAGTGSIGALIDADGRTHRVGGRGSLLDDGGSGYWIAREALRSIWRREDERPGAWRASPLACAVFERLGGADWARSREFVYQSSRGSFGELALTVASAADSDPEAHAILVDAGVELARLGNLLLARFGTRSVALTGGVLRLHPIVESSFREALHAGAEVKTPSTRPHVSAACFALEGAPRAPA